MRQLMKLVVWLSVTGGALLAIAPGGCSQGIDPAFGYYDSHGNYVGHLQ